MVRRFAAIVAAVAPLVGSVSVAACKRASTASVADTALVEGFESGTLRAWQDGVDPVRHRVLNDPSQAHSGNHVLEVTYPAGGDGGWLTHWFMPGYDSLLVSFWLRLDSTWQGGTKLLALYGSRSDDRWSAMGQAGRCPTGTDFFAAMLVTEPTGNPGPLRFYAYYPAMAPQADGVTCWGRHGEGKAEYIPAPILTPGKWHHLEFWVKLNAPGRGDGRQTFRVDGEQWGHWSGVTFRTTAILRLNSVQLTFNAAAPGAPRTQKLYVDDVVVTTRRG